jgi:hypothetical protein
VYLLGLTIEVSAPLDRNSSLARAEIRKYAGIFALPVGF